jgi:hypothetical protein
MAKTHFGAPSRFEIWNVENDSFGWVKKHIITPVQDEQN